MEYNRYIEGETVICECDVLVDGEYQDPDIITITINHPFNGIEVDGVDMVKDSTGKYHYDYTIPESGHPSDLKANVMVISTISGRVVKKGDYFTIVSAKAVI